MGRSSRRPPTIVDVAALAGVSKSTVSNVLRGVRVAPPTRERVEAAIDQLGYRPNAIARQFVAQQSTTIGVVTGPLSNPWHGEMASALEGAAFQLGYMTSFCNVEGDDHQVGAERVEALLEQRVSALLVQAEVLYVPRLRAALEQTGVPVVFVAQTESWADSVDVTNVEGGRIATEHLLSIGHQRIAYVTSGDVEASGDAMRHQGYREAMHDAGLLALEPLRWIPGSSSITIEGVDRPLGLALRRGEAPTAVFVSNDGAAIALIDACESHGIEVPRDLSVAGFDGISISSLRRISLTTVAFSFEQIATAVLDVVRRRVGGDRAEPQLIRLPGELKVRGSTAPAARG